MAPLLPTSSGLPIHILAGIFKNVTNSYKFYWFLAILAQPERKIPLETLLATMIASVWYPAHYFRLSFGKQDQLSDISLSLPLEMTADAATVQQAALDELTSRSQASKKMARLGRYVPYRFLRPFFATALRGATDAEVNQNIVELTNHAFTHGPIPPLYRFVEDAIEIHPIWHDYLQQHRAILEGFCLWHLLTYLQRNNPNVSNLASKLFAPEKRNLSDARKFWREAFKVSGSFTCIYSGQPMTVKNFSLDHFLPWRFVTHDLLWNIIPTPQPVNSAKSDNLPHLDDYFDDFARLQYDAFQAVGQKTKGKLLDDYVLLFKQPDVATLKAVPFPDFKQTLYETIAPQTQIAKTMGFAADWRYQ